MLRLSKLTDYSTVIMFFMARRPTHVHSAAEVAAAIGVALPTASKLLKLLARENLLSSRRGAKGGYVLARPPEQISVAQVIEAMEGSFGLTECASMVGLCPQENGCPARAPWQLINQAIRQTLDHMTLADMLGAGLPGADTVPKGGTQLGTPHGGINGYSSPETR